LHPLVEALENAKHILIIAHVNPDADSMGSALAMYTHVLRLHKKVTLYCQTEKMNPSLSFLPFFDKVRKHIPRDYDLAFSFDCGAIKRLGIEVSGKLVNVDHHVSNENYGDINLVDTTAISTTQVLYDFFKSNAIKINSKMATCLYAGLVDDSECFTTHKTGGRTFEMAADLIQCGADNALCVTKLFKERSLASLRLKAKLLSSMTLHHEASVVSTLVQKHFFEESGALEVDCEEALNESLELFTVKVAFMLRYTKEGRVKGSLRSCDGSDMNALATKFGGGGHKHSAGFVCEAKSLEEIESKLLNYLKLKDIT